MASYKSEDGWVETSAMQNYQEEVDRYDRSEKERRRRQHAEHQAQLGPTKTWRELEIERLDRLEALWRTVRIRG